MSRIKYCWIGFGSPLFLYICSEAFARRRYLLLWLLLLEVLGGTTPTMPWKRHLTSQQSSNKVQHALDWWNSPPNLQTSPASASQPSLPVSRAPCSHGLTALLRSWRYRSGHPCGRARSLGRQALSSQWRCSPPVRRRWLLLLLLLLLGGRALDAVGSHSSQSHSPSRRCILASY